MRLVLARIGLDPLEVDGVLAQAMGVRGLMLYGSRARDDFVSSSDFDLLFYSESHGTHSFKIGRASVSSYTREQLSSASGTLFGTHLRRDGNVLVDQDDELKNLIDSLDPADPQVLLRRVRDYSAILNQPSSELKDHMQGLVRLARYLLRTATYAKSMLRGRTSFSVRDLAVEFDDPRLVILLASDPDVTGPPSSDLLEELIARLTTEVGSLPQHQYGSVQALAVGTWDTDRTLSTLAIRAADEDAFDGFDYSDLPKVML